MMNLLLMFEETLVSSLLLLVILLLSSATVFEIFRFSWRQTLSLYCVAPRLAFRFYYYCPVSSFLLILVLRWYLGTGAGHSRKLQLRLSYLVPSWSPPTVLPRLRLSALGIPGSQPWHLLPNNSLSHGFNGAQGQGGYCQVFKLKFKGCCFWSFLILP